MVERGKCEYPDVVFLEVYEEDHPFLNRVANPESYIAGFRHS